MSRLQIWNDHRCAGEQEGSEQHTPASVIGLAPRGAGVVHRVERRVHPLQQLLCAGLVHVEGEGRTLVRLHIPRRPAQRLRLQQACRACAGM